PRRTPASARRIDSSAVRFACSEVSPSVTPSTPATDNVAAMKILAPRPIRAILVALASGIRRVIFAVLVLMGRPAEPASVERQLDSRGAGRRHVHRLRDFRTPLDPFDLGQYGRGEAKTWTFTSPGLVRVFCNIHPRMVAFVQVMAVATSRNPRRTAASKSPPCRRAHGCCTPGTSGVRKSRRR